MTRRPGSGGLAFIAAMLVICGAVKGGDVEDCRNAEGLLKTNSSRAVSACRRLADQGDALARSTLASSTTTAGAYHRTMPKR